MGEVVHLVRCLQTSTSQCLILLCYTKKPKDAYHAVSYFLRSHIPTGRRPTHLQRATAVRKHLLFTLLSVRYADGLFLKTLVLFLLVVCTPEVKTCTLHSTKGCARPKFVHDKPIVSLLLVWFSSHNFSDVPHCTGEGGGAFQTADCLYMFATHAKRTDIPLQNAF